MTAYFKGIPILGPRGPAGPDGNPLGTVLSFLGTKAPADYLVCDGSEYSTAEYPDLADFFEQQFGAKNQFGGDGVTTFAVPDLRGAEAFTGVAPLCCIKAVVSGNYEKVYSEEEQIVGQWLDGKPLYQKTFAFPIEDASGKVLIDSGVEQITFYYGVLVSLTGDGQNIGIPFNRSAYSIDLFLKDDQVTFRNVGLNGYRVILTVQYTKTARREKRL